MIQGSGGDNINSAALHEIDSREICNNVIESKESKGSPIGKKYFHEAVNTKGQHLTAMGNRERPKDGSYLEIPKDTTVFKLYATYFGLTAGFYKIRWRIRILEHSSIPNGLKFTVDVSYGGAEPDVTGTFEVQLPEDQFKELEKNKSHNLEIEENLSILPHIDESRVSLILSNNNNEKRVENSGIIIEYAEIVPLYSESQDQIEAVLVKKQAIPKITIPPIDLSDPRLNGCDPLKIPVTRLSPSLSSYFLASLAVTKDIAVVTIWNTISVRSKTKNPDSSIPPEKYAARTIINHTGIEKLSIGISLSSSGNQVAIYQEPKIGEWKYGTPLPEPEFPFKIYNNPLPALPTTGHSTSPASALASAHAPNLEVALDIEPVQNEVEPRSTNESQGYFKDLEEAPLVSDILSKFVGFGTFLPESKKGDQEKNDLNDALLDNSSDETQDETESRSMFVACNGIYLDVFEISSEKVWSHIHTITLKDLTPTLNRRITCMLLMESISTNTFMWLEDNGACCTIWNIMNGSSISYISSPENSKFKGTIFRGRSKMAISPRESTVAIASIDGRLTTYFANTGMVIESRQFLGHKIEYVGFHGEENEVLIILRNAASSKLSTRIVDSYQLKCENIIDNIAIPTIGSTVLCFFSGEEAWKKGVICEPVGSSIGYHLTQNKKIPKIPDVKKCTRHPKVHEKLILDSDITYKLRTACHREYLPEGEGMLYYVLRVELLEQRSTSSKEKIFFSFIPEPWMRSNVTDDAIPEDLVKVYFLDNQDRFAVVGAQSLQIWNLPSNEDPKCSLAYIYSKQLGIDLKKLCQPSDVGSHYYNIVDLSIYTQKDPLITMAEINISEPKNPSSMNDNPNITTEPSVKLKKVYIPERNSELSRHTVISCFRSIHLLANAYAYSKKESKKLARDGIQVTLTFNDHAEAIVRFARGYINRALLRKSYLLKKQLEDDKEYKDSVVTLLTILLDAPHFSDANNLFVEGLLTSGNGEWIPRGNKETNPIKRAISSKNEHLVQVFVDYCITNAKKIHPAYLIPAIKSLNELSANYPVILADMFRRASYVPAHNQAYVASHAIVANVRYADFYDFLESFHNFKFWEKPWFAKSHNINEYVDPVFCLRSQLPVRATKSTGIRIETPLIDRRIKDFPIARVDEVRKEEKPNYTYRIYVCPFPKLSYFGAYQKRQNRSAFTKIAGRDFFDSPAMVATLKFKWYKYGFFHWVMHFFCSILFFIFMCVITGKQIATSTIPDINTADVQKNQTAGIPVLGLPTLNDIKGRYLEDWHTFIILTIILGFFILFYDARRIYMHPKRYLTSPFNLVHTIAHLLSIVGLFIFLLDKPGPKEDGNPDDGPSQIWILSFGILALYMNLMFELRVIKQLGLVVNVIIKITRKILWFFVIFSMFLLAFTHALLHLLHTRSYRPDCMDGSCAIMDYVDGYSKNFFGALSQTYFFLAGRFDPISSSFDQGSVSFHIMMVIFFFFTILLLLNVLIALMNDAFNESSNQGQLAWLKQWSEVVSDIETSFLYHQSRQNRNLNPDYIYYGSSEKIAKQYESNFAITDKSNLSIESRFLIETMSGEQNANNMTQRKIIKDVQNLELGLQKNQNDLAQELVSLRSMISELLSSKGSDKTFEQGIDFSDKDHLLSATPNEDRSKVSRRHRSSSSNYNVSHPIYFTNNNA